MPELVDVSKMSAEQLERLLEEKRQKEADDRKKKKDAYVGIRAEVIHKLRLKTKAFIEEVENFHQYIENETGAFKEIMGEYGELRNDNQLSYTLKDESFKIIVKTNKVKRFDERADVAAAKLIEFLRNWIKDREKGTNDPMYQLGMLMIERNRQGDLDYKSISKLYELEDEFNHPEYTEIMKLFRESNTVEGTATNFYFEEKDKNGVWRKLQPNFNRL